MHLKILFTILLSMQLLQAGEYAVVSNKSVKTLSKAQIKAIYLKKLTIIDDKKIIPINLDSRNTLRKKFNKEFLHLSLEKLKIYWIKQHYLGHRPPLSFKSQEAVKKFINKVDDSIGYLELKNIDKNQNIIYQWSD